MLDLPLFRIIMAIFSVMAGSRQKAVEAVKHALYIQSHGGAIGRFYVQRTLEHLQQCNHFFREDVKEVKANLPNTANHAFKRFIYENIPQLKYRNPATMFDCKFDDENPSQLKVIFGSGMEECIETEQNQSEIYNAVVELTKQIEDENLTHVAKEKVL